MTSWPEARRTAWAAGAPLAAQELPLGDAVGCVLASALVALDAVPAADTAAMDGWAVCGRGPWRVVGRVLAGDAGLPALRPGEAVEVATGASVPAGSEGVLAYEDATAREPLTGPAPGGRHVRRVGEECAAGELLLPAGALLTAAGAGLAAALGHDRLWVHPRPRVVALVTGSELLTTGRPRPGQVRDAVGPMLAHAVDAAGGRLAGTTHLRDDRAALLAALTRAEAEVVLTSGASSVGPADHLTSVLCELGAQVLVRGVAVRPGHPQLLARLPGGRLLVGLPGNPLAALSGLVTLVGPLLAGLSGRPLPTLGRGVLDASLEAADVHRLVPVRLTDGTAYPTGHAGAAMLRGAALAQAFAVVEPGRPVLSGDELELVTLP